MKRAIWEASDWFCTSCGCKMSAPELNRGDSATIDHINPQIFGRDNRPQNLRGVCRSCNSKKGIKDLYYDYV
jgi:5-methylcytosine-specific restriction endonuclease McrA